MKTEDRTTRKGKGSSSEDRAQWKATYESTNYDELPWFDPDPSRALVRAVKDGFFPPKGAVLDVGCGAGSNVLWLARAGYEAHGIDLSPGAIRAARKRAAEVGLSADFQEGDALALDFPAARFDAVTDHGCFHTLPIARRPEYAGEIARVLRAEGSYLLCWVAREHTESTGPPHRASLNEVTEVFESRFLFTRTEFRPGSDEEGLPFYAAWLRRRSAPQPPLR
jgi:ubiquinone/menaquinone biosynthesis C-methylase UbiE